MKISSEIINCIISQVPNQKKESGGLLGFDNDKTIVRVQLDKGLFKDSNKYTYYPNVPLFNQIICEWAKMGISFAGIFHTHYSDKAVLSDADIYYIEKILLSQPHTEESLFFPLLLIPSKAFIPFEAKIDKNKNIKIQEDSLIILS